MGKVYFLDNDVILKLTTYRMLDEALDCFKIDRSDIRVLASARYFLSIEIQGFDWVLERVIPNLDCDKALKSAFGSGSNSQCETVLGTLNGYIQDLQTTSSGILSDM